MCLTCTARAKRKRQGRKHAPASQTGSDRWWELSRTAAELIQKIADRRAIIVVPCYEAASVRFCFSAIFDRETHYQVFGFADDYSFGILQSHAHWLWFIDEMPKMKSDFRYTPESVFDTFPWPQTATVKQIDAVAAAARELRRVRAEALPK